MAQGVAAVHEWEDAILAKDGPHATIRLVLVTLSCRMSLDGDKAYPSTKVLADRTGLTEQTVCARLKEAAEAGWVRRLIRPPKGRPRTGRPGYQYLPAIPGRILTKVE